MDATTRTFSPLDLKLRRLLGTERKTQVEFLRAFGEYGHSKGYEKLGYATLWEYGRRELRLLKGQLFRRIHSARILRIAPQAADYLLDGRMSMTTLAMLKDVISRENADRFLEECAGKTKEEVEYIVRCAQARVVSKVEVLRKLPARPIVDPVRSELVSTPAEPPAKPATAESSSKAEAGTDLFASAAAMPSPADSPDADAEVIEQRKVALPPRKVEIVEALSVDQYLVKILVEKDFVEILEKARLILSHKVPSGSIAEVLREALLLVIARDAAKHGPKKQPSRRSSRSKTEAAEVAVRREPPAVTESPSSCKEPSRSTTEEAGAVLPAELGAFVAREHERIAVPAATLRQLWQEEGGRCTAPLANGETCGSQWQLQTEHRIPVARGGTNDRSNLCLRCRAHNLKAARDAFGRDFMDRWTRRGAKTGPAARLPDWKRAAPGQR